MSSNNPASSASGSADALLAGLSRLSTSNVPTPSSSGALQRSRTAGPTTRGVPSDASVSMQALTIRQPPPPLSSTRQQHPQQQKQQHHQASQSRQNPSDPTQRARSSYPPRMRGSVPVHSTPSPRVEPFAPMSRLDMLELVEHATKLADKSSGSDRTTKGDRSAAEAILHAIRNGSLNAVDVFRGIVAGSSSGPAFNMRVLHFVHWLCFAGGPLVLEGALHTAHPRRPCGGLRVVLDVLRTLGYENAEDLLYDDQFVRNMSSKPDKDTSSKKDSMIPAIEAYAIMLGRKFIFHQRCRDVEFNFSLDRFYRSIRVENEVDSLRRETNDERHSMIIRGTTMMDVALIARAATVTMERIRAEQLSFHVFILALSEASNAVAFTQYLQLKIGDTDPEFDVIDERKAVARRLQKIIEDGGSEARILHRYVDHGVIRALTESNAKPCRPESRHRREIRCEFSSFETMHDALRPNFLWRSKHNDH